MDYVNLILNILIILLILINNYNKVKSHEVVTKALGDIQNDIKRKRDSKGRYIKE